MIQLFRVNVGSIIQLTTENIKEAVECYQEVEDLLPDNGRYSFINLGKVHIADETQFLLLAVDPETKELFGEGLVYSYNIDEVHVIKELDLPLYERGVKIRLLDALTSFIEESGFGDDCIEEELEFAEKSIKVIKTLKQLS